MLPRLQGYLAIKDFDDRLPNDPGEMQTIVSEVCISSSFEIFYVIFL